MQRFKVRCISIITSIKGAATYILLFTLIPLVLIVPAMVMDFSAYYAVRTHLQNVMDVASTYGITHSTDDRYRADKELYIIKDSSKPNAFINQLKICIDKNFNTNSTIDGDHIKFKINGINIVPYDADLLVEYKPRSGAGQEYKWVEGKDDGFNTEDALSSDSSKYTTQYDLELSLSTHMKLPVLGKVLELFSVGPSEESLKTPITIKTAVRGARIKNPGTFTDDKYLFWEMRP